MAMELHCCMPGLRQRLSSSLLDFPQKICSQYADYVYAVAHLGLLLLFAREKWEK